jgi:hypothetical protein
VTKYHFGYYSYKHGAFLKNVSKELDGEAEARKYAQHLANTAEDEHKIVLLFRQYDSYCYGVNLTRHVIIPLGMYWPEGVMDMMQTFFEVL